MFFSAVPSCPVDWTNVAEILKDGPLTKLCILENSQSLCVCEVQSDLMKQYPQSRKVCPKNTIALEQVSTGCSWRVSWPWPGQNNSKRNEAQVECSALAVFAVRIRHNLWRVRTHLPLGCPQRSNRTRWPSPHSSSQESHSRVEKFIGFRFSQHPITVN